jgi:adenylate cyclase
MQSRGEDINASTEDDLPERLRLGLGIHVGCVIVGEIDQVKASQISELVEVVYLSSQLKKRPKEFDAELIVSHLLLEYAGKRLPDGETHETFLKGGRNPFRVIVLRDSD